MGVNVKMSERALREIYLQGFEGVIMSDWDTTGPKDGSIPWRCVAAGNDMIMPGSPKDDADIRAAYAKGELSEEAIRTSAGRVLAMIQRLTAKKTEEKINSCKISSDWI